MEGFRCLLVISTILVVLELFGKLQVACLITAVASYLATFISIFCATESGHAQSPTSPAMSLLFQCSGQNGQVFTPNIPDFYFDDMNAATFIIGGAANLTTLSNGVIFIFTIPPLSAQRNCSGNVMSIQYCYQAKNRNLGDPQDIFSFLSLMKDGFQFTIIARFLVQTTPQASRCTSPSQGSIQQVCCDTTSIVPTNQPQIPSSEYTFGILTMNSDVLPLAFRDTATEYQYDQFHAVPAGSTFTLSEGNLLDDRSLMLLRLFIGILYTTL